MNTTSTTITIASPPPHFSPDDVDRILVIQQHTTKYHADLLKTLVFRVNVLNIIVFYLVASRIYAWVIR